MEEKKKPHRMVKKMPYIEAQDRNQIMMCSLDSMVDSESIVRIIDKFVDGLDLESMGFKKAEAAVEGRPAYDPRCLLKLYLYGSRKKLRSSRRLEEACHVNVEAKWLMSGLEPDFRTISDFRKDNAKCLKKVFHEFNRKLAEALTKGFVSVDGSKFQANNSKDNNFTAAKLDDRIERLNRHTDEYLRQLAEMDEAEETTSGQITREEVERKLEAVEERLKKYKAYRDYMEEKGLSQISLVDHDARLMKSKDGFVVGYNVQTAVDSETHMVEDYLVTNHVTDHGLLGPAVAEIKKNAGETVVEAVADRGYHEPEDMAACLENGVIPNVILPDGKGNYELEIPYEGMSDGTDGAEDPDRIRKRLRAGIIPEEYEGIIESAEVIEKKVYIKDEADEAATIPQGSAEEMKERAGEGYFVRDAGRNLVYCPAGEVLRQKSIKKNGDIRYANKAACRRCKDRNKCYKGKNGWKEIDFNKDTMEKPCKDWLEAEGKEIIKGEKKGKRGHYEVKKVVKLVFRPDQDKMGQRKCISEHPFGTIKRWMDAGYYLLCGKRKVDGETALMCLGYNLVRAMNLLGFKKMMEIMA